jgi:hypothetical protein
MHEIHELGIMYLNYEILSQGYQSIFLGESLPVENLKEFTQIFDDVTFLTYFTVEPNPDEIASYINNIRENILTENSRLWITGRLAAKIDPKNTDHQLRTFSSIAEIINELS